MATSDALSQEVREKTEKLSEFFAGIQSCRVAVEAMTRRHHRGNVYRVRVDLSVPGEELVFGRETAEDHAHEDPYVAVRDAFDGARRLLQDFSRRQRGEVKATVGAEHAKVARIFKEDKYGFLETTDGRDVYFHENSVLKHGFPRLAVGMEVRYTEEEGDRGPQASSVCIVGKDGRHVF